MSGRILVVEDTEDNRRIMRDLLTAAGYELFEAETGEIGVAMAKSHRPDLILMDIQLPVLDGYEASRRIKADPALRGIPIIAVTSYALSGDEEKARAKERVLSFRDLFGQFFRGARAATQAAAAA